MLEAILLPVSQHPFCFSLSTKTVTPGPRCTHGLYGAKYNRPAGFLVAYIGDYGDHTNHHRHKQARRLRRIARNV